MGVDAEMFVRTRIPFAESQVRRWAYELRSAFGNGVSVIRPGEFSYAPEGRHCLEEVSIYEQDGPDIRPDPGERFLQAHVWTRYYGPGYERGDLPLILAVARWLSRIPGASVWYGGDSSGVCAEPLDDAREAELWGHFVREGHRPYRASWFTHGPEPAPHCDFCDEDMVCSMRGGALTFPQKSGWYCVCGYHVLRRDGHPDVEATEDYKVMK